MAIDQSLLDELRTRRAQALYGGGPEKLAKRHEKGQLSARERIVALFDPETFMEFGAHADHGCTTFGMANKSLPGDGVVTGVGFIAGRAVAAYSHDFTVGGGHSAESTPRRCAI